MLILRVIFFVGALFSPLVCFSAELPVFPKSIGGDRQLPQAEEAKRWSPDTMYEHVNGEAELLKRYGTESLAYTSYENSHGDYLSAELFDMGKPINAYGLYRLYAGCEAGEYQLAGATVLGDDYTSFAILGRHFLRINTESDDAKQNKAMLGSFMEKFIKNVKTGDAGRSMIVLEYLQEKARKPCEVQYHPEHLDYDLEAGPGYGWVGPDGQNYFLNLLPTEAAAQQHADALGQKGVTALIASGKTVLWRKESGVPLGEYPREVIQEINAYYR